MGNQRDAAADQLARALEDEKRFSAWLAGRGYRAAETAVTPNKTSLAGVRTFGAVDPEYALAPRILALYRPDMTRRSLHGAGLRQLQKDAFHFRERVALVDKVAAPDLFVLASPDFLMVFPLDDDFARRQRFTVDQLRHSATLAQRYESLTAATMTHWCRTDEADPEDSWADLDLGERHYDWLAHLYGGGRLDEEFVAFMGQERRRLVEAVLDPGRRAELLQPMLAKLDPDSADATPGEMTRNGPLRKQVIAAVDTVLLRLVLYRYLEAQFADEVDPGDRDGIGLGGWERPGSWDALIDETADVNEERHDTLVRQAKAAKSTSTVNATQLDLFAPPEPSVRVHRPDEFVEGVKRRAEYYQQSAGGDLHRGRLAEAADVVQGHLLDDKDLRNAFATLIEGTRSTRYSFNYEDLDPRAFQRFYEETIGTDIGLSLEDGRVRVIPRVRNRKEQGAYFTDERVCRWLVDRTLGRWFQDEWLPELERVLPTGRRLDVGGLEPLREHLGVLAGLRVLDPTCGGGIFLRAAFEFLSRAREVVALRLETGLTDDAVEALRDQPPARYLLADADPGEWEWHLLLNVLHGVDIDIKAINIASNLLTLSALTYRPRGLHFPSFINTNLKRGNALVTPVAMDERAAFARRHRERLVELMELRAQLRAPRLTHGDWEAANARAGVLTAEITDAEVERAWRDAFGDVEVSELHARVAQVGVCLFEAEFPEVFFAPDGAAREDAGFDFVLGNPPWEAPAKQLKQFLPEFEPDYRELDKRAAMEAEARLLGDPRIAERWERFQDSIDDYRLLLAGSGYEHQVATVHGRRHGSQNNLYAFATELAYRLVRPAGQAGLVLDGGIWNDLSCVGLRRLLLDRCEVTALCGFVNQRKRLFPGIDSRMKFGCIAFTRGGRTGGFAAVFMRTDFDALRRFGLEAAQLDAAIIRADTRESYPIPEVRNAEHWSFERATASHPVLRGAPWSLDIYTRELHANDQRHYFHANAEPGWLPLIQGTQFNHWGVYDGAAPDAWVDPSDDGAGGFLRRKQEGRLLRAIADHIGARSGKEAAARQWLRGVTGTPDLPTDWLRLDWDGYRLAWRDICRNDDRRTLIAGVIPPGAALTHTAPFVRPFRIEIARDEVCWPLQYQLPTLLYLAGMLTSYACDAVVRSRLSKTHLTGDFLRGVPVPAWADTPTHHKIADLAARLTCRPAPEDRPWADYTALAAGMGLTPERDGLTDPDARRDAEVELNALACSLYGLDRDAFRFLMTTLFDTPKHRDTHFEMRDRILKHGWKPFRPGGAE